MAGDFLQIAELLFRIGWLILQLVALATLFENMPLEKTWKARAIYVSAALVGLSLAFFLAAVRKGGV